MSGMCGRLSWPTALITACTLERLVVPSARCACGRARSPCLVVERGARAPRSRSGCAGAGRARRRTGGSSRAARPGSEKCCGHVALGERVAVEVVRRRRPGSPGRCSRTTCRRRRRSSRRSRTARPACCEAMRGEQARHAGADDRDRERRVRRDVVLVPAGRPQVRAADRELLASRTEKYSATRPSSLMRYAISRRSSSSVGSGASGLPASRQCASALNSSSRISAS